MLIAENNYLHWNFFIELTKRRQIKWLHYNKAIIYVWIRLNITDLYSVVFCVYKQFFIIFRYFACIFFNRKRGFASSIKKYGGSSVVSVFNVFSDHYCPRELKVSQIHWRLFKMSRPFCVFGLPIILQILLLLNIRHTLVLVLFDVCLPPRLQHQP